MSLFIILLLSLSNSAQNRVFDLESYIWKNRIVLLFTDDDSGTSYRAQVNMLLRDTEDLEERDLKIFKISDTNSAVDLLGKNTFHVKDNLRVKYNLKGEGFHVLLIGKDGSVKYSDSNPLSREKLFAIIDAMPMRKAEMKQK